MQYERKLLGIFETQAEEIRELKRLLYAYGEKLIKLKNIIKGIAKDVSSIKDTSRKVKFMAFHLA